MCGNLIVWLAFVSVANAQSVWPTSGWPEAAPESQGVDSQALIRVLEHQPPGLHTLLVIRHGKVILDSYFYPFAPGMVHDAASVTKTVTSVLTGIAVDQGLIKTSQPAFAGSKFTIENLLTMTSGLECGFKPGETELAQMKQAANWTMFARALPAKYEPGTRFAYCSPGFHLISAAISEAAGTNEFQFAKKQLFEPLGIKDVVWPSDAQGVTHGWGNSHFYPRDLAKIGYLYLHEGRWDARQVVSAEWVKQSIAQHSEPRPHVGYGYGWWLYRQEHPRSFEANGRGGQKILVLPDEDAIVIMTGGGYDASKIMPLLFEAIKSEKVLPVNAEAHRQLLAKVKNAVKAPAAVPIAPVPPIGASISGKIYSIDQNGIGLQTLLLRFNKPGDASVTLRLLGYDLNVPLGLDGVYKFSPDGPLHLPIAAKGAWTSANEFLLDVNFVANINHYTFVMRFDEGQLRIVANEASGLAKI